MPRPTRARRKLDSPTQFAVPHRTHEHVAAGHEVGQRWKGCAVTEVVRSDRDDNDGVRRCSKSDDVLDER